MSTSAAATLLPIGTRRSSAVGIVAGLLTLAVASIFLWQSGAFSSTRIATSDLQSGTCVNVSRAQSPTIDVVPCATPHNGEIVAIVDHPDAGSAFPGTEVTEIWFAQRCNEAIDEYLGHDVRTTTLAPEVVRPTEDDWNDGHDQAICYLKASNSQDDLTASVAGRAEDYRRDGNIPINQLAAGDCFVPADDTNPFELRSGDIVELVSCEEGYNGVFFGQGVLPNSDGADFPATEELTASSTRACAATFQQYFGLDSSVGYTFRFWRPSRSDWDSGSREVLCAVLSGSLLEGPYTPADYPALANLGTGQCFQLLPEQDPTLVSLDDHVRPVVCSEPHVGQMIGTGELTTGTGFPGDRETERLAEEECRTRFEAFVGVEPNQSSYGRFPFWYPDEASWIGGDTRYACAILGDEVLTSSVRNTGS